MSHNPGQEPATHEPATHEAATHEAAIHEAAIHEPATHEAATHEAATHEADPREADTCEPADRRAGTIHPLPPVVALRTGEGRRALTDFVSASVELAGVGIDLASEPETFSYIHAVCRHCAEESPVLYARCGETMRQGLASGGSRICSRGHRIVGYEGGLSVVMPKTMTVAGRGTRRSSGGGTDRLDRFLRRLRSIAGLLGPETAEDQAEDQAEDRAEDRAEDQAPDRAQGHLVTMPDTGLAAAASPEQGAGGIPVVLFAHSGQMRDPLLTSMARSLVAAIDAKDRYTRGHSERVQIISSVLGDGIGLDETRTDDLYWASLLHDVGKIGVPDRILTKTKRLTRAEHAAMRRHPELGAGVLEPLEWLARARLGVLHHHERIDGTGYPAGLAGDQIPLIARIIAAADTFDAIISRRHYRLERSAPGALEEMIAVAGTQLDLNVVAAFETAFDRICAAVIEATHQADGLRVEDEGSARAA